MIVQHTDFVGVQREDPGVFKGLLVFVPRQTHSTVSPAELPTWTTCAAPLGRAHKQWLTLLAVFTLGLKKGEINTYE